jgi:PEP-CTERM motif-containing protein
MKKGKLFSKNRDLKRLAKRLASYSAAVGLGAFAGGHVADGAIIYVDLNPDLNVPAGTSAQHINVDGAGYNELALISTPSNQQFRGVYGGVDLTNTAKGNDYYVRSFDGGDAIGPGSAATTGVGVMNSNAGNFGVAGGSYGGFMFDMGGQEHYGWVRMEISSSTLIAYDFAYESAPGTAIVAGAVPEPSSLALLAAGAGGMAFRRRRKG